MFLFSIVIIIVMMTTVNTMSMAIMERTKEIGTLRSLGLKRRGISLLFAMEGAILGFLGSLIGIIIHTCVWFIIKINPPYYMPPGFSISIPMFVDMLPLILTLQVLCLVLLATVSAIIPARRAARKNIVDALGHI